LPTVPPPPAPWGTAQLQACSPTSWSSCRAGEPCGAEEAGLGEQSREPARGTSYLCPDLSPRLAGLAPQEPSWVPSGPPAAEPAAAWEAQGLLLEAVASVRLPAVGGLFGAPFKLLSPRGAMELRVVRWVVCRGRGP